MALSAVVHRSSHFKQKNKKHNVLGHKTKGQISARTRGRIDVKEITKHGNRTELDRQQRKNRLKQIRSHKRQETYFKKRLLGSVNAPPFLVGLVPLSIDINPRRVLKALSNCDPGGVVSVSAQGITHLSCPRFKQRFSFVVPPSNDLYSILDALKVCDTVLFVWPLDEDLSNDSEMLISCIFAQGLPSPIHSCIGLDDMSSKEEITLEENLKTSLKLDEPSCSKSNNKRAQAQKNLLREISAKFPGQFKVHSLDRVQDVLLLIRQIGAQKRRDIFYRDKRSHMMAEKLSFVEEGVTGTLQVYGYVRGQPFSANSLIHIPGWGDYQISQIESVQDPFPLQIGKSKYDIQEEGVPSLLELPDPELQQPLISTNEIDPLDGEQTWPTEEELKEAEERNAAILEPKLQKKRVPKGTSGYQATWICSDNEGDSEDEDFSTENGSLNSDDTASLPPMNVSSSQDGSQAAESDNDLSSGDDDDGEFEEIVVENQDTAYDEKADYDSEMKALEKYKGAERDRAFPDEVDTPLDTLARLRFQKYRGLQSFRTSTWDPKENLPIDYARIFQFENFAHAKKRILRRKNEGIGPGLYVIVHLKDVPLFLYKELQAKQSPLVIFALLPHEQKMSVLNIGMKSHTLGHLAPIKSKERLIFHVGFRRFATCPVFSEHSTGNKHKFERYFHPGETIVATTFAPITIPPCPVMVFKEVTGGAQILVATGSVLSVDPSRIVCKRVVLSGYPFKISKKLAVIRFMFFNREDIMWFKPVELRTKWGRRGHIREPLGTHGHMKCIFNGQLKSQDIVLMHLYKRVFPKWTYDAQCPRPLALYEIRCSQDEVCDDIEILCEPQSKRSKKVHFQDWL